MKCARMSTYTLEVLRRTHGDDDEKDRKCNFKHVGYMAKTFPSTSDAARYYNKHNKHMPIMSSKLLISAVDEKTHLLYVIRQNYAGLLKTLPSFEENGQSVHDWCLI